jgi:hypothetical protein
MFGLFFYANAFSQDIIAWDVSSVTGIMMMLIQDTWAFNQDISTWSVSSVTTIDYMFINTKIFNQSLCTCANKTHELVSAVTGIFQAATSCSNHQATPAPQCGTLM